MGSFKEYINGYAFGVKSLLVGMRTSMKVFMQKKVTERYPENRHTTLHIPERHRAMLVMPKDENGNNKCLVKYEYDLGSCMFCQLCVNACPHDAIRFSNHFENAVFEREKLVMTLNEPTVSEANN